MPRSATIWPSSAIHDAGAVDQAFAESDAVVEADFIFGRHTGVTLEPRSVVADWNAAEARLTIYQGTQAPHMVQNIAALHLGLKESQVRVVCKDVGGSFGIKVHIYADEMATYALSKLLRRPIKFVADRVESFNTDIHARDHRCKGKIGVKRDGTITAFEIDDLTGIGPYSMYPRTSAIEANQVVNLVGGPYTTQELSRAGARRVPEQERHVPVPRRRPSHRLLGDGRAGRSRRDEDRDGPGRDPPPQSHCRRRLSLRLAVGPALRAVVAPCLAEQARSR